MMQEELDSLRIDRSKKQSNGNGGKRFWIGLSLFLLMVVLGLVIYMARWEAPIQETSPEVVEAADRTEMIAADEDRSLGREVLIASGYVVAHHTHELGSKVMGRVEWIGVEKGDFVDRGQLLVKLEDREYRAQLEQAEAALGVARKRLAELQAGSRPEEVRRAEAERNRARAQMENARLEWERLESLLEAGVTSRQEVDNAKARFDVAAASLRSSEESLELLRQGPRREQIEQAEAEVAQAEAAVRYAETMLDATEIRAPISGTVLRRIAEIGEMVTTSFAGSSGAKSAVVALADLDDLQVELDISQMDFKRISGMNLECEMTPEAFPDQTYPCRIDEISPEANRQKASIQVKVKILEPDDHLRPEMSARVTFLRGETEDES